MIKANEFRIGNFILFKEYGEGDGKIGQMKRGDFGKFNNEEYHTIPLTPDWLKKMGVKDDRLEFNEGCQLMVDLTHGTATVSGRDSATFGQSVEVPCKYVHQLQNLYFSLTGEELAIKEMV